MTRWSAPCRSRSRGLSLGLSLFFPLQSRCAGLCLPDRSPPRLGRAHTVVDGGGRYPGTLNSPPGSRVRDSDSWPDCVSNDEHVLLASVPHAPSPFILAPTRRPLPDAAS